MKQDCQNCPYRKKCWNESQSPSASVLTLNLLVCRLKMGIKTNSTTRLILEMLEPKVQSMVKSILQKCPSEDRATVKAELQTAIIESIMTSYDLGGRAWPLHYLFAYPRGTMWGWYFRYLNRVQKSASRLTVLDNVELPAPEPEPASETPQVVTNALQIIDDGFTLTGKEYRIFNFCLQNSDDMLQRSLGHVYLATTFNEDRSSISRIYRKAQAKIIEACGQTESVLGVKFSTNAKRRRARMFGLQPGPLTPDEVDDLLSVAKIIGRPKACQVFGVNVKTFKKYATEANTRRKDSPGDGQDGL